MQHLQVGIQNIADGQGIDIAITGMLIVFSVLVLISGFIALLPRILATIARKYPESPGVPSQPLTTGPLADEEAVLAAIGYVLHTRQTGKP